MKFPGETWVGNLYQKFEAVCHEVDGLVSQDIRNLESHVQSVGDEVMKLCSNVKDLLPSSLGDPAELKAKSASGVICDLKLESGDVDCVTDASQILPEMDVTDSLRSNEAHDQVSDEDLPETHEEHSSSSSELPFSQSDNSIIIEDHDVEKQSSEVSEQNSDSFAEEKQSASCGSGSTLVSSNSGLVTEEEEESPSNFQESISPDEHLCERAITVFCDQNHSKGDMISENSDGNSAALVNPALLELSHHCEADFFSSKSNTCNWSVIEIGSPWKEKAEDVDSGSLASTECSNDEGSKQEQMKFSVRFEGSCCVFVERESIQEKAPSRKKRVKGAFWRRKRVVEKEYRQLGLWYGDIDAELDECSRHKLISPGHNSNNKHLSSSSSSREKSEWELL